MDFADKWLGKKVKFKLLGKSVIGEVIQTDNIYYTLSVEFKEKHKTIIVNGHFNCFRKVN